MHTMLPIGTSSSRFDGGLGSRLARRGRTAGFELDLVDDVERLLVFVLDEVFMLVLVTGGSRKSTRSYSVLVLEQLK
jgi:hypothetical protein